MRRCVLLGALALFVAGCGGEENLAATGAGAAQVRLIENLYGSGQFDRAWSDLHPAHQVVVSQDLFARCARRALVTGDLESIEVLDVFDDDIAIPGIPEREAKAVRARVASLSGESFTTTDHHLKVGERWRWVLNPPAITAYRKGRCP
jgi:hypothetical protein